MAKPLLLALLAAALAATASAQAPPAAPPKFIPRARGPATGLAVEAGQTAIATCKAATGAKVTALVVDSAGATVALIGGDGAPVKSQEVAASKAATVIKYKMSSGEVLARTKTDAALDAATKADPRIEVVRQGAIPIMVGADMIGALAVAGSPGGGDKDEACARAGLAKIAARLS